MVELHLHSNFSDGSESVEHIIEEANNIDELTSIAITDHDNCKSAFEVKILLPQMKNRLTIYPGTEFGTSFEKVQIEVVGIGFDYINIDKFLDSYFTPERNAIKQKTLANELIAIAKNLGCTIDDSLNFNNRIGRIYEELAKYPENKEKFPLLNRGNTFIREGIYNPNSPFFLNYSRFFPTLDEIINLVHQNGGKLFLAHLYVYDLEDHIGFLKRLFDKYPTIDGCECFYPTFTQEQTNEILSFCLQRGLLISGGSDNHGLNKKGHDMGCARVDDEYVNNWLTPDKLITLTEQPNKNYLP